MDIHGFFTAGELAKAAGCTMPTLLKWLGQGLITAEVNEHGTRRYHAASLQKMAEADSLLRDVGCDPRAPFMMGAGLRFLAIPPAARDTTDFTSYMRGYLAAMPTRKETK